MTTLAPLSLFATPGRRRLERDYTHATSSYKSAGQTDFSVASRRDSNGAFGCSHRPFEMSGRPRPRSEGRDHLRRARRQPIRPGLRRKPRRGPGATPAEARKSEEPRRQFLACGALCRSCGRCRIRTYVGFHRQIYSLLPLAARATCRATVAGAWSRIQRTPVQNANRLANAVRTEQVSLFGG